MKCDELKEVMNVMQVSGEHIPSGYYKKSDVDAAIAELKAKLSEKDREIALLKDRICNGDVSRLTWIDDCIAKDKEIAELKQKLGAVNELVKESKEFLKESQKMHKRCADNAIKKIRHHKFKRCEAMAKWCESEAYIHEHGSEYDEDLVAWFGKWYKRWRELADKFKEAK